jgi:hypothetical protein
MFYPRYEASITWLGSFAAALVAHHCWLYHPTCLLLFLHDHQFRLYSRTKGTDSLPSIPNASINKPVSKGKHRLSEALPVTFSTLLSFFLQQIGYTCAHYVFKRHFIPPVSRAIRIQQGASSVTLPKFFTNVVVIS